MKRFLIPAFFCVDAETLTEAELLTFTLQSAANTAGRDTEAVLFTDEELPTKEVQIGSPDDDLPHTYNVNGRVVEPSDP